MLNISEHTPKTGGEYFTLGSYKTKTTTTKLKNVLVCDECERRSWSVDVLVKVMQSSVGTLKKNYPVLVGTVRVC